MALFYIYPPTQQEKKPRDLTQVKTEPWYLNGKSINHSIHDWQTEKSYAIKRASAYELLKWYRSQQEISLHIRQINDYKPWAAALTRCIDNKVSKYKNKTQSIQKIASHCVSLDLKIYF